MKPLIAVITIAAFLFTACAAPPGRGAVLYVDDFSNPETGFNRQSDADAVTDYADSQYKIEIFTPNLNVWSVAGPQFADALVEVNAHTAGGTENNLYGVICRHQDDDNFYFFGISADGYYAIGKVKDGSIVMLSSTVFEFSDRIITGQAANHIAATCAAQTLTLTVNNSTLAEVTDADFSKGQVGLIAGTFNDAPTDVRFGDLLVTQP
jgi:hypothetical protein